MLHHQERFVIFKFFLAICKNICQRKLFIWYHRCQNNSFLGVWFIVSRQLYHTISSEGLFVFFVVKNAVFMQLVAFHKRLKE